MSQRLWNSSLSIVFSVILLVLAALVATGVLKTVGASRAASEAPTVIRCAELPVRDSLMLDAFYLREI